MLNWPVLSLRSRLVMAALFLSALPAFAQTAKFVTILDLADLQAALSGGGTVEFQVGGTLQLTSTLNITNDATLDGHGQTVTLSGSNAVQVFHVFPGVNFALSNLTVASGSNQLGAAIFNDKGTAVVRNCVFSGNISSGRAGSAGGVGSNGDGQNGGNGGSTAGGAIYNTGQLQMLGCELDNNAALGGSGGTGGNGGGGYVGAGGNGGDGGSASGGAIFNSGTLILAACKLTNNLAIGGFGGTNGSGGTFFAANGRGGAGAGATGGAIFNSGTLVVTNCSFLTNSVTGGSSRSSGNGDGKNGGVALGGAIYNSGTLIAGNSTFSANAGQGGAGGNGGGGGLPGNGGNGGTGAGGAVYTSSSADFLNCTLAGGSAVGGARGLGGSGGTFYGTDGSAGSGLGANLASGGGTTRVRNTILAYPSGAGNASGVLTDAGHNLSSDSSAGFKGLGSTNNVDPLLSGPAANGATNNILLTMALSPGSPAIAGGDPGFSPAQDERGMARSASYPSIGAYEFNGFAVEGAVYNNTTAVSGVTVNLGSLKTTTDTNGNYLFSSLTAGVYPIDFVVSGGGFSAFPASQSLNLTKPAQTLVVLNSSLHAFELQLLSASAAGTAQIELIGAPSEVVVLQASGDLVNWAGVGTYTLNSAGALAVVDSGSRSVPIRFYRMLATQ